MQQPLPPNPQLPLSPYCPRALGRIVLCCTVLGAAGIVVAVAGCGSESTPNPAANAKPFGDVALTIRCPDSAFAIAITPAVNSWASRVGATVTVRTEAMAAGDNTDIGIIPAAELGSWAERGDLAPVPAALRAHDHPFQWSSLLPAYREHLIEWGGQAQALPLAGDGYLVIYRADRLITPEFIAAFQREHGRTPTTPTSWEDFAALAGTFAAIDGKPSLPPMTATETADLFFRVAACYDRSPLNDSGIAKLGGGLAVVSFFHNAETSEPLLRSSGFQAASVWLGGLASRKCFATIATGPSDPVTPLSKGEASIAVVSLAQLAKFPRQKGEVPPRFGIAALPGTRTYLDPEKKQQLPTDVPNYIPCFAGGWLGVVRSRCPNAVAAFDLLADLGGPTRSLELLSAPGLGIGPFRNAHLERDRLVAWYGYGFDPERSKTLQETMRQYVRLEVRNPVYGLRAPDQRELSNAAAGELAKIAAGQVSPPVGLEQLIGAWNRLDEKTPKETRLNWRRHSAGAN